MIHLILNIAYAYIVFGFAFAMVMLCLTPEGMRGGPKYIPDWLLLLVCISFFWLPLICSKDGTVVLYRRKIRNKDKNEPQGPWSK